MSAPGTALVLEFTGLGPAHSLAALLDPVDGLEYRRTDPLDTHIQRRISLAGQAAQLAGALPGPPRAVLGHCTAARLAVQVAAACPGPLPVVVLLDPDPVSSSYVTDEFAAICTSLGGRPGPLPGGPGRLPAMEAELSRLTDGLRGVYGGDEDAAELAAELAARYAGWLRFLAAGAGSGPVRFPGEVIVVSSGDQPADLDQIVIGGRVTCLPGRGVPGTPLLASPDARQAVRAVLARIPADASRGAR